MKSSTFRKIKLIEQMEHSECGLACVAMILNYNNFKVNLSQLREKYGVPVGGFNLFQLKSILSDYGVESKGVNINNINELAKDNFPFIGFWNKKHFVIIEKISKKKALVADPALGRRWIKIEEFHRCFSQISLLCEKNEINNSNTKYEKIEFIKILLKGQKKLIVILILLSLIIQFFGVNISVLIQNIIDNFLNYGDINFNRITWLTICIIFSFYILNIIKTLMIGKIQMIFDENLMVRVYKHILKLPYSFFTSRTHGELVYRMNSNIYIRQILSDKIVSVTIDSILFFAYLLIMIRYSIGLSLIVFFIAMIIVGISIINTSKIKSINENEIIYSNKIQTILNESISGILTIKVVGGEDKVFNDWFDIFKKQLNSLWIKSKWNAVLYNIPNTIQVALPLIIFGIGSYYLKNNLLTVGSLIAFNTLATYFISPILSLTGSYSELVILRVYIDKLLDILTSSEEITGEKELNIVDGSIEVENLSFRYNAFDKNVINNISFNIESKQKVAIVGKSGSGKSTLLKLLMGIYKYETGKIKVDNIEIDEINPYKYRTQLGVVLQEPQIFNNTIKENISFGRKVTLNQIENAVKLSNINDFIKNIPLGDNTIISENGANLSGGQRQRVSLARALINNPKIIFMDEPTSSLDNESEKEVINNIFKLDSTCIIVSHRFYNIDAFDKIIFMENGSIVDIGTHRELISRCSEYDRIYNIQDMNSHKKNII